MSTSQITWTAHDRIGSYRLVSLVGTGRGCQVWAAIRDIDGQRFAVKVVLPTQTGNKEQAALLKREYGVGRSLEHPNIIRMYEIGAKGGALFVVMELFASQNVKQLFLQGQEHVAYLVGRIAEQSAAALGYLHSKGWIHRDVKPDNFLINRAGELKMIDFALAERRAGVLGRLLARRGKIQGTRSYMSPEQIRGQGLDERSDIYGLACMLHELVGGKPPFTGQTTQELLNKHLTTQPPPLEAANREVTSAFSQLVRKMLSKKPQQRPQSMDEVLRTLKSIQVFNRTPDPPKDVKAQI